MNFYQHQDRARRKTGLLAGYFFVAVALIAAAINAVIFSAVSYSTQPPMALATWLEQPYWLWVSGGVVAAIALGTLYTTFKLRGGGPAVAEMVGARRVDPSSGDRKERQLINVVEEMSIASGTPVPALYVLDDEPGINAFVAGTRPTETVLVVTCGALDTFTRDELQGVVGHEYSHIFNHDMSINIRLMGILAGILLIGQIGRVMLHSGSRSSGKGSGQAAMIGLAILIIGYIGLFFGALIKAAVSRQREFLADASAVQFTRNPQGIAGALDKIRQHVDGSLLNNAHSEDVSHFCFGESVHYAFASLMATHPRLDARIKAVDPNFVARQSEDAAVAATSGAPLPAGAAGFAGGGTAVDAERIAESVGTISPEQVAFAEHVHHGIPEALLTQAHAVNTSPQVVYALLMAAIAADDRHLGMDLISDAAGSEIAEAVEKLSAAVDQLPARARLPLVNISLPALKMRNDSERREFLVNVKNLIEADRRYTVFEFALLHILRDHLSTTAAAEPVVKYYKFEQVGDEVRLLLSVLARVGAKTEEQAMQAFEGAYDPFGLGAAELASREQCKLEALTQALNKLAQLSPLLKKNVISACADCVIHDGKVTAAEGELLQAIAINLDCPMPPLLDG